MSAIMTATPTFDQVVEAARRIEGGIIRTPCVRSAALSELCGANVWCKLDYQQSTGSFKERGGRNALMQLDAGTRAKGVIAASAGNHALALAYHGRALGIAVTVVKKITLRGCDATLGIRAFLMYDTGYVTRVFSVFAELS